MWCGRTLEVSTRISNGDEPRLRLASPPSLSRPLPAWPAPPCSSLPGLWLLGPGPGPLVVLEAWPGDWAVQHRSPGMGGQGRGQPGQTPGSPVPGWAWPAPPQLHLVRVLLCIWQRGRGACPPSQQAALQPSACCSRQGGPLWGLSTSGVLSPHCGVCQVRPGLLRGPRGLQPALVQPAPPRASRRPRLGAGQREPSLSSPATALQSADGRGLGRLSRGEESPPPRKLF